MIKFSTASFVLSLLCSAFVAAGCSSEDTAVQRTTPGDTALSNLDAQIDGIATAYARRGSTELGMQLVSLRLSRIQYTGRFSDFETCEDIVEEMFAREGESASILVTRARLRSAQHQFELARGDLEQAAALGADTDVLAATIDLATGKNLDRVLDVRERAYDSYASFSNTTSLAAAYAARGEFAQADALFSRAAADYRDVSPLPLAWLAFQRGVMWAEQADQPTRSRQFYEEAVHLLPAYVVANVHLAELEADNGDASGAIARLEGVASETEDPEPMGLLSDLLAERNPTRAHALAQQATSSYESLFQASPLAFLDHGSEFFAGPGPQRDPARAVDLALVNLQHRKNPRAYLVALAAAQENEDSALGCRLVDEASSIEGTNINLENALAATSCPRP